MKLLKPIFPVVLAASLLAACGGEPAPADKSADSTANDSAKAPEEKPEAKMAAEPWTMTVDGITVTEKSSAPEFPGATLSLNGPEEGAAGMNNFSFTVEPGENGYELGNQTEGAAATGCANSGKGQHIHFIVNNQPYKAHYTADFEGELSEGLNVMLAFISRSYHESLKHDGAYVLKAYQVGDGDAADLSGEHLFYSRPKGKYVGADAQKLLLDFYLVNTSLAEDGNKVRVTIDGSTQFVLPKWCPYTIEGLEMGERNVRIELIDAEGNLVPGPFNDSGDRTITLLQEGE